MEKSKLTIPYIIHNWKSLKTSEKRAVLTVVLIAAALLLFLIALIVGIASCSGKTEEQAAPDTEAIAPLPALLRAPDQDAVPDTDSQSGTEPYLEPIGDDPENGGDPDSSDDPTGEPTGTADAPDQIYQSLKKHDKGEDVTTLQTRLMELGYLEIEETTDYFGSSTEYAVQLFQRQHGLEQDGVAGAQTLSLLYSSDAQKYMIVEGAEGRVDGENTVISAVGSCMIVVNL